MFGNIGQAVGGFFSNLFGGNRDDDKRRREREAAERRRQQAAANARQVQQAQQSFQAPGLNRFNQTAQNPGQPQTQRQQSSFEQMRGRGAGVMTPEAREKAAAKEREQRMTEQQKKVLEATRKASEQLRQIKRSSVRDVNNYRGTDEQKLKLEIAKGENADLKRVEGLLRSVKNRQAELKRYSQSSLSTARRDIQDPRTMTQGSRIKSFVKAEKTQREGVRDNKLRKGLQAIDKEQLGGSIRDLTRRYNNASSFEQTRIRKELEERAAAALDYGNQKVARDREEAKLALLSLDLDGKRKFNPLDRAAEFGGNMIGGMADYGMHLLDSASVIVNDGKTLSEEVIGARQRAGNISQEEAIRQMNRQQNRLSRSTGGMHDRGLVDRLFRSAAAGAEGASYAIPGAAARGGLKGASRQTLRQALSRDAMLDLARRTAPYVPANVGAAGAAAFREGEDTRMQDVAAEAALGGLFAAGAAGVGAGSRAGINSLTRRLPAGTQEALRQMTPQQLQDMMLGRRTPTETPATPLPVDDPQPVPRPDTAPGQTIPRPGQEVLPAPTPPPARTPASQVAEPEPRRGDLNTDELARRIEAEDAALLEQNANLVRAEDGSIVDRQTGEIVRESPAVRLQQAIEQHRTEAATNTQQLSEAAERQAAPEAGPAPTPDAELEANSAYGEAGAAPRGNIVPDNYMAEIERRRAAFAANEDKAILEAQAGQRQREAGYDPTGQIDRTELGRRLARLGVDPRNFEGVTVSRLNQIIDGAERADNPGGYIRSALRDMEAGNRPNPTQAAMNNNITAQRFIDDINNGRATFDDIPPSLRREVFDTVYGSEAGPAPTTGGAAERFIDDIQNNRATFDDVPPSLRQEVFDAVYGGEAGPAPTTSTAAEPGVASLSRDATNSLVNDQTGMRDGGVERSGQFVENATAKPVEYRRLEDGSITIVDGRHTLEYARQNGIEDFPVRDVTAEFAGDPTAAVDTPPVGPARGTDGTYSSAFIEGIDPSLPVEQRVAATKELSDTIVGELDARLQQAGSSQSEFFQKLERARDGEVSLTPDEARINEWYQAELENIARYTEQVHGIQIGRRGDGYYSPEYTGDFSTTSSSQLSDMFDGGELAGSTYRNKGKAREQGLDYSVAPTERYIQEMLLYGGSNTRAGQTSKLADSFSREAQAEGRPAEPSAINKAASMMITLMDQMSYGASAGRGKKAQVTKQRLEGETLERNLEKIPVVQRMNEIGRMLNKATVPVVQTGNAKDNFLLRGKVNNMQVGDSTLGEQGVNLFYESRGYGDRLAQDAFNSQDIPSSHVEPMLDRLQYLSDSDKSMLLDDLNRRSQRVEEQISVLPDHMQADALVQMNANNITDTLRKASRMNLIELSQRVDIQRPADLKTFQDAANRIMVNERIQQGYVNMVIDGAASWINAALRGYNPKSAATELGDLGEIVAVTDKAVVSEALRSWNPAQAMETMNRWGRMGSLDPRGDFMAKNTDLLGRIHQVATAQNKLSAAAKIFKAGIDPMLLVKGVTLYKESIALNSLERYWTRQGLSGAQLVDRVYRDYYETVLPASPLNKSVLSSTPARRLLFQYQNWQAMNAIRTYNFMTGQSEAGRMSEMGRAGRIATFASKAGTTKLGLWAVQNTLFGSSLAMSFGLFDPLGITQGDFTGVDDEDKSMMDRLVEVASFSPFMSLAASGYFAHRQEEERVDSIENEEYVAGDQSPEYNGSNVLDNFLKRSRNMVAPGANQFFRTKGFLDASKEGYSTNDQGRVQYQTPEVGTLDWVRGLFGGKGATSPAREYSDSADILRDPLGAISKDATVDNLMQVIRGEGTRDYNRPLATSSYDEGYNEQAIAATQAAERQFGKNSPQARRVMADWIENGRKYNRVLDDFRKNNPEMHQRWIETMDDDVISPEKWQIYRGNPDVFEFMKERKALEARDLGRAVDPIYSLPPEHAALVLQERSAHTGEDIHLRTLMYQYPWYEQFKDSESAYYDTMIGGVDRDGGSDRAKVWYELSNYMGDPDGMKSKYPLVAEQQRITQEYGFGSDESSNWFRANADAYLAEKEVYDQERFGVINQMRALEGVEPMTWEQFKAKIEFPESDSSGSGSSSRRSRGRGGGGRRSARTPKESPGHNTIAHVDTRTSGTEAPRAKRSDTPERLRFDTSPGGRTGGRKRVRVGGASRGAGGPSI